MKLSRLSKRITSLVLALALSLSTSMSVLALQLPPDDDDDDEEDTYYTLAEAIQARRDNPDEEESTSSSKKNTSSSGKTITVNGKNSSSQKVITVGKNSSASDIEVVSPTQSGKTVSVQKTTSSSSSTSVSTGTSSMAATIRSAQKTYNNTDIQGWLKVDGTNINYGVVKTPVGQNISYYEAKGYDKQYSKNGVLWTNSTVNFGSSSTLCKNTCIFGHNWTNSWRYAYANRAKDVMLAQLVAFKNLDFAKKNQKITFSTEKEDMTFQIFAVFICNADKFNYVTANPTTKNFGTMIDEARSLSFFDYNVDVTTSDKIITLSTCIDAYYKNGVRQTNQRLVVMGKLVKGDAASSSVSVTTNKDAKTPTF